MFTTDSNIFMFTFVCLFIGYLMPNPFYMLILNK